MNDGGELDKQGRLVCVVAEVRFEKIFDFEPRAKRLLVERGKESDLAVCTQFLPDVVGKVVNISAARDRDLDGLTPVVLDPEFQRLFGGRVVARG